MIGCRKLQRNEESGHFDFKSEKKNQTDGSVGQLFEFTTYRREPQSNRIRDWVGFLALVRKGFKLTVA